MPGGLIIIHILCSSGERRKGAKKKSQHLFVICDMKYKLDDFFFGGNHNEEILIVNNFCRLAGRQVPRRCLRLINDLGRREIAEVAGESFMVGR